MRPGECAHSLTQASDIGTAAALCVQPAGRPQSGIEVAEQRIVVEYPVERCGTEDSIEAVVKRERNQVSGYESDSITKIWRKILLRMKHHVSGKIKADDVAERKILQKNSCQFSGAATGIQQMLIAAQPKFAEHSPSPLKLRRGEAMVFCGVPFARWWRFGHYAAR
jgi:hypothetical protein